MQNWNCDGNSRNNCSSEHGTVKLYPTGGDGNMIFCFACWQHENRYNAQRVREGAEAQNFPQQDWETAKVYESLVIDDRDFT